MKNKKYILIILGVLALFFITSSIAGYIIITKNWNKWFGNPGNDKGGTHIDVNEKGENTTEDSNDSGIDIKEMLIGSWHALPGVPAGYDARYIFYQDGKLIYMVPQNQIIPKDKSALKLSESNCFEYIGTWNYDIDSKNLSFSLTKCFAWVDNEVYQMETGVNENITLTSIQKETDPDISYKYFANFDYTKVWKYSNETNYWNDIVYSGKEWKEPTPNIGISTVTYNSDMSKFLVGSWHALPMVPSGYADRYVFYPNGDVVFSKQQEIFDPEKEEEPKKASPDDCYQLNGTWTYDSNTRKLSLKFTKCYSYDTIDIDVKTVTFETSQSRVIQLGKIETETEEGIQYRYKVKFGSEYFWKYSDYTDYWEDISQ